MFKSAAEKIVVAIVTSIAIALLAVLWAGIVRIPSSITIPTGAVMAFDRRCDAISGWSEFSDANGRFIVGAGRGTDSLGTVRNFSFGQDDMGVYEVAVLSDNLPPHTHAIPLAPEGLHYHALSGTHQSDGDARSPSGRREAGYIMTDLQITTNENATESIPLNNLPPFVVLYYCMKD
jgi:hypothetical protein